MSTRTLYVRWVVANALAELVGLGGTFGLIGLATSRLPQTASVGTVFAVFAIAVAAGSIEATIVGLAQHWAMAPAFPTVSRFAWWRGTLIGALVAYALGYLPSTLFSLGEAAAGPAPAASAEPPQWLVLLLAAALGLVAGAVLSFAQWLALRGKVERAGLWIPANMLAWAVGMPVIFQAMDLAFKATALWQQIGIVAVGLLLAGTAVGAIHGRFLVALARSGE